jgi:hypothetical protein
MPLIVSAVPSRGLKYVGVPSRRCKHCWREIIEEKTHIFCTVHKRHRQIQKTHPEKLSWIMTHATQGGMGKGGQGTGRMRMLTQKGFRLDF